MSPSVPEALDAAARRQLEGVADLVREVLGGDAIGAYLHGSTASGRLQAQSDLDVLVVSRRPTSVDERLTLIDRLLRVSGRGDPSGEARSIELTIVVQSDVRPWRHPPAMDLQYGDWFRPQFERGELTPWASPNADLAPVITMVLSADTALFGPPPAEVLDPVPREDLARAIVDGISGLLEDLDTDTANVLLTFARIWTTLATGEIRSKDAAAEWALARLPQEHRPILLRARAIYLEHHDDTWDDLRARLQPHVDHVLAELDRARESGPA